MNALSPQFILYLLLGSLVGLISMSAQAQQQCVVEPIGPFSLASRDRVKVCATNLDLIPVPLGIAYFDAFDARKPIRVERVILESGDGICVKPGVAPSPRLGRRTLVALVGAVLEVGQLVPLAVSAEITRPQGRPTTGPPLETVFLSLRSVEPLGPYEPVEPV